MKSPAEMTDDEFREFVVNQMLQGWIPVKMYLKMFPTETLSGIDTRVARKHWVQGVHYNSPPGSTAWVNLIKIREWASGQEQAGVSPL